jgi:hypothetical protein
MIAFEKKYFSRDQWRERGRIVCVPNAEAAAVVNYWEGHTGLHRGAWHVFSEDQTVPMEQLQQVGAAA